MSDSKGSAAELGELAGKVRALSETILSSKEGAAVSDAAIQDLLTAGVQLYALRWDNGVSASPFRPDEVNATEVSIAVTAMLDAVGLQLFELSMWRSWSAS